MSKIILFFVTAYRRLRSNVATRALQMRAKKYGTNVCAARIPHIGSEVSLEIGHDSSFNGFTATGWGGGKNW